jgi:hypothetical protein
MPIRPIDLQTLFMQLGQVGKDQAVEKDGPALQAAMQGAAAQKRLAENKEAVRGPEEPGEGTHPVKEDGGSLGGGASRRRASEGKAGEQEEKEEEVVKDPSLGNRVDLSG